MPLKGDFDRLQSVYKGLAIGGARAAQEAAKYCADEALKLTRGQLRRAEAPDNSPWAPLVLREREAIALQQRAERAIARGRDPRARLRKPLDGLDAKADAQGVLAELKVNVNSKGADISNRGVRRQVQRQIVPLAGRPMPERWRKRLVSRVNFLVWRLIKRERAAGTLP